MQVPSAIHHPPEQMPTGSGDLGSAGCRTSPQGGQVPRRHSNCRYPCLVRQTPWSALSCNEWPGMVMQTITNGWRRCISTRQLGQPWGCRSLKIFALKATEHRARSEHRSIWSDPTAMSYDPGFSYRQRVPQAPLRSGLGRSRDGECSAAQAAYSAACSPHCEVFGPYLLLECVWFQLPPEEALASSVSLCRSLADQSCIIHTRSRWSGRGMSRRYILWRLE